MTVGSGSGMSLIDGTSFGGGSGAQPNGYGPLEVVKSKFDVELFVFGFVIFILVRGDGVDWV